LELKLSPPLKSVAALPCEKQLVPAAQSAEDSQLSLNYGKCSRRMWFLFFYTD